MYMFQGGTDPGLTDNAGRSALMVSAERGHRDALLLVLASYRALHRHEQISEYRMGIITFVNACRFICHLNN